MRDSDRITRTPGEYADYKQAERQRTLRQLLGGLRAARERHEEWYVWVVEGQPRLTDEQYERAGGKRSRKRTSRATLG